MADPAQHLEYATAGGYRVGAIDLEDPADMSLVIKSSRKFPIPQELSEKAVELVSERMYSKVREAESEGIGQLIAMQQVNVKAESNAIRRTQAAQPTNLTQVNIIAPDGASVDYRSMIARVRGVLAAQRAETD